MTDEQFTEAQKEKIHEAVYVTLCKIVGDNQIAYDAADDTIAELTPPAIGPDVWAEIDRWLAADTRGESS